MTDMLFAYVMITGMIASIILTIASKGSGAASTIFGMFIGPIMAPVLVIALIVWIVDMKKGPQE